MSALQELLTEIVDYAGLFPPAGLDLNSVVKNYARYQNSPARWMLARLIVPAGKLDDFLAAADLANADRPWRISALVPSVDAPENGLEKALAGIREFNDKQSGAVVDAVEVKCPSVDHVAIISNLVPTSIRAFLEVPHQSDPVESIQAIAETKKLFAKIRTGGVTPDLIPPAQEVSRFICRCAEYQVGFKATAGLHHPIRDQFNLTYEPDSATGTMHGFLNLFVATALAFSGAKEPVILEALQAKSISEFVFEEGQVQFGSQTIASANLKSLRQDKMISFGSCSFEEPVSDLRELGFESEIPPVT